jgi:hypothetical protein
MRAEIVKRTALILAAIFAYSLIVFFLNDATSYWNFLKDFWMTLLPAAVVASGWVVAGSFTDQAWNGMKSAFPDRFQQDELPKHFAIGVVQMDDAETGAIGPVVTSAVNDGLIIAKVRKRLKPRHFICIPWSRVKRIWVAEPKGLAECKSAKDCGRLAERLRADVSVARGDYPPIKIEVPWHDMFGGKLPPNVDLRKTWEWPYAVHTAI